MKKEEKKVPALRFRGFTDDWEQRKFGELANYKKGPFGSMLKKDMFVPRGVNTVKIYEQQNAINKNWQLARYFITKEYANKLSGFETHGGDIIVSCAGTIGELYELPCNCEPGIINQALMRIRVYDNIIDKNFYELSFSNMIYSFSKSRSNGSAIKNIPPFSDLKSMVLLMPKINEQKKIGYFFHSFNVLITLHQRKLEQLKTLKKYFLQNMFPAKGESVPNIRFKGFTGNWECQNFADVFKCTIPNNTLSRTELSYKNGSVLNVHYGDILIKYGSVLDIQNCVMPRILNKNRDDFEDALLKDGDVIIADTAEDEMAGKACEITNVQDCSIVSGLHTIVCRPRFNMASGYLGYYLNSNAYHRQLLPLMQGTKVFSLNKKNLQKTVVNYPPTKEEQRRIAIHFYRIDNLITLHQNKLDQLQTVKKFMLQNMFVS